MTEHRDCIVHSGGYAVGALRSSRAEGGRLLAWRKVMTMKAALPCVMGVVSACAVALGCHNQSSDDDRGQALGGKQPDRAAVPPQPMIATSAGPVSSAPAANLAATVPKGPPLHDGDVACTVQVGNVGPLGRELSAQNAGNLDIKACDAVVYVYDKTRAQIARAELSTVGGDAGISVLAPKAASRKWLPVGDAIARDPDDWFVPVVVHVEFADGFVWDAPKDRAPALRPLDGEPGRRAAR
jgi:hypothetical protein